MRRGSRYLRTKDSPQALAIIPKDATPTSHGSCEVIPLSRSNNDPRNEPIATTAGVPTLRKGCGKGLMLDAVGPPGLHGFLTSIKP
jgi:hypothetical protein